MNEQIQKLSLSKAWSLTQLEIYLEYFPEFWQKLSAFKNVNVKLTRCNDF